MDFRALLNPNVGDSPQGLEGGLNSDVVSDHSSEFLALLEDFNSSEGFAPTSFETGVSVPSDRADMMLGQLDREQLLHSPLETNREIPPRDTLRPLNIATVNIDNVADVGSIDNVDTIGNVDNVAHIADIADITDVADIADITGVANDTNVTDVDGIPNVDNVAGIADIIDIPNETNLPDFAGVANVGSITDTIELPERRRNAPLYSEKELTDISEKHGTPLEEILFLEREKPGEKVPIFERTVGATEEKSPSLDTILLNGKSRDRTRPMTREYEYGDDTKVFDREPVDILSSAPREDLKSVLGVVERREPVEQRNFFPEKNLYREQKDLPVKKVEIQSFIPGKEAIVDPENVPMPRILEEQKAVFKRELPSSSGHVGVFENEEPTFVGKRNEGVSSDVRAKNIFLRGGEIKAREMPVGVEKNFVVDVKAKGQFLNGDKQEIAHPAEEKMGRNLVERDILEKGVSQSSFRPKIVGSRSIDSQKILDLSTIPSSRTLDIVHEVVEHMDISRLARTGKIDVQVRHNELGQFELNVMRGRHDKVDLDIKTDSTQGHQFFQENEGELIKSLNRAGIRVGDLRVFGGGSAEFLVKGELLSERGEQQERNGAHGRSDHPEEDADSRRRRDLWEEYRERYRNAS